MIIFNVNPTSDCKDLALAQVPLYRWNTGHGNIQITMINLDGKYILLHQFIGLEKRD
jgi:hypothetical protein